MQPSAEPELAPVPMATRTRLAVGSAFCAFGIVVGAWAGRLPAVAERVGADHATLGVPLTCLAAGCVVGMTLVAPRLDRVGTARALPVLLVLLGVVLVVAGSARSVPGLCVALVVLGAVQGTCNVAMNARATALQEAVGRPVLAGFHALFSIGGFIGAGIAALVASLGGGVLATFLVASTPALVAAVATSADRRTTLAATAVGRSAGAPRRVVHGGVALLAAAAFAAMLAEGAVADWGSVHLRDSLGASAGFAALPYSVFAVSMTLARLGSDRAVDRFGGGPVLLGSAVLAVVAFVVVAAPSPVVALVGCALVGAGLAAVTPVVFAAAGSSARGMSAVVGVGYVGFLVGPALIGFSSAAVGLRWALLLPALGLVAVAVLGGRVVRRHASSVS